MLPSLLRIKSLNRHVLMSTLSPIMIFCSEILIDIYMVTSMHILLGTILFLRSTKLCIYAKSYIFWVGALIVIASMCTRTTSRRGRRADCQWPWLYTKCEQVDKSFMIKERFFKNWIRTGGDSKERNAYIASLCSTIE
jgi:hypothetical protein